MKQTFYLLALLFLLGTVTCSHASRASHGCRSTRRRKHRTQHSHPIEINTSTSIATGSSVSVNNAQFINNSASLQAEPSQTPIKVQAQQDDWRQEMLTLLNNLRAKVGKKALVLNSNMNKLAQDHSDYQASIKTMTHNDTKPLGDRVKAYGIRWGGIAENVVYNTKTVSQAIQAWANSPGHYRNMIGDYEIVGFGETNLYWTQNFASYL